MPSGQSYWRLHNKPPRSSPRRRVVNAGTREEIRKLMRQCTDEAVASGLGHFYFPFESIDVAEIYTNRLGETGLWFRLHNGRVFNNIGEQELGKLDDYAESSLDTR